MNEEEEVNILRSKPLCSLTAEEKEKIRKFRSGSGGTVDTIITNEKSTMKVITPEVDKPSSPPEGKKLDKEKIKKIVRKEIATAKTKKKSIEKLVEEPKKEVENSGVVSISPKGPSAPKKKAALTRHAIEVLYKTHKIEMPDMTEKWYSNQKLLDYLKEKGVEVN